MSGEIVSFPTDKSKTPKERRIIRSYELGHLMGVLHNIARYLTDENRVEQGQEWSSKPIPIPKP